MPPPSPSTRQPHHHPAVLPPPTSPALQVRTFVWRKAGTLRLEKNQARATLELAVPVTCANLKLHFEALYEDATLLATEPRGWGPSEKRQVG